MIKITKNGGIVGSLIAGGNGKDVMIKPGYVLFANMNRKWLNIG